MILVQHIAVEPGVHALAGTTYRIPCTDYRIGEKCAKVNAYAMLCSHSNDSDTVYTHVPLAVSRALPSRYTVSVENH